jgi:dinuclear metal center YbgI/SA1388 family protein
MQLSRIIASLENWAPSVLQETYDNAGLLTGDPLQDCTGVICALDVTENIISEAIGNSCNLIVAHHPFLFTPLKKITGSTAVERTLIQAIKHDIAVYAIHTNLDNVLHGVNGKIADRLGIIQRQVLEPKANTLRKLYTFVPVASMESVRSALFKAGAGHIGQYSECSFSSEGHGTFKASAGTAPFVGKVGERHTEKELKLEVIFPFYLQKNIISSLKGAHPYEEVAYDVVQLENTHEVTGSGLIGHLQNPMSEKEFLMLVKKQFETPLIRHTALRNRTVNKVALCGGAGSFLARKAKAAGADAYLSADFKYHEFFEGDENMILCDIGHFESEQFTMDLLVEHLTGNFPTFAIRKSVVSTNPVRYYF